MASGRRTARLNERLPRGRHGLPREAVTESQQRRILQAMIEVVAERGYPDAQAVHSAEESLIFALPKELRLQLID